MQLVTDDLTFAHFNFMIFPLVWNNIGDRDQLDKFLATYDHSF